MIGNIKSSILPLALWTGNPPVHNITSILHLDKSNAIVTGSECGHIFIWSTKTCDNQLVPLHYIIGHRSKILTLVLAGSRKYTDIDYFVSFSKDGELGLWEASNGRSIEFVSNASFDVQSVVSFESENVKQRLLFCCLKTPEIVIINSMSLSELCTLKCTNCSNLFSSVTSFNINTKDDMVLASSVSGVTSMWVLNFADINSKPNFNPKFNAEKSLKIDLSDPIKITHNPHQTKIVLIISACKFMVYHAKDWSVLCYQNCRRGDYFINGEFISSNCILVHCQSGKSFYYKLPPRSDVRDPLFGQMSSNISDNIPHLMCQFREPQDSILSRAKVTTKVTEHGFVIWKGSTDGCIYKWEFKANMSEIDSTMFNISCIWKAMKKSPSSLAKPFVDSSESVPVTSLLYISDLSLFVLGMHDGSIFITNFENSLASVFRNVPPNKVSPIKLTGHSGPVLCLIHPFSTMKLSSRLLSCSNPKLKACQQLFKLSHVLWSGGEDFSVRIWDIKTQQCISVFHCHSTPVILFRLNHLPSYERNVFGLNQGPTPFPYNSVSDDDANGEEIRQMINVCMNAFMVVISEDEGISIITLMKPRLLLYSAEHDSPIKNLGWALDSQYVLLETTNNQVYVWDLCSRAMDRCETDEMAQALMENCSAITKVKSQSVRKINNVPDMIGRHSLSNLTSYNSFKQVPVTSKSIKFQFIKTGLSSRYIPVIIFDVTTLLNSLDVPTNTATKFYSLLSEIDNSILQGFRNSDSISKFDTLMKDVTAVNRDMDLKILMIKIIFSRAHFQHMSCPIDSKVFKFLDLKSDTVACSFGSVNAKTGCISFSLKDLFRDEAKTSTLTIENLLLQLSISTKMNHCPNQDHIENSLTTVTSLDVFDDFSWRGSRNPSTISNNFSEYYSSSQFSKLLLAYETSLIDKHIPMILKKGEKKLRFSDCPENLSFCSMEKLFHSLILGVLDVCDWISSSAYRIIIKIIQELSFQEIQNYFLIIRTILLPDLDRYTTEGGKNFSLKIQSYLHRFSEQSLLASDWIWWYTLNGIKIDQDKRKLTKIQIKTLVYLALIGTYLPDEDNYRSRDDIKSFSNMFAFDNYFLARITCDFLCNLLNVEVVTTKHTKNRLIGLAMHCLSHGFLAWEPYLNSSTLIYQLFEFAEEFCDGQEGEDDDFQLTTLAKKSLHTIAQLRPQVFVMACYREMLRHHNGQPNYSPVVSTSNAPQKNPSLQRMKSSPGFLNSYDSDGAKKKSLSLKPKKRKRNKAEYNSAILNRRILFPILEELLEDTTKKHVAELLPEIVELYLNCNSKAGQKETALQHLLYPVLKFDSVSIDSLSGQVAVGSSNGSLSLFSIKTGKFFTTYAHRKSIQYTKLSSDSKYVATYCIDESQLKIYQISHSGLFHMGGSPYHVKLVVTQDVPSIDNMILAMQQSPLPDVPDGKIKEKKSRSLKRINSKAETPTYRNVPDQGLGLQWNTDNKTVAINFNGLILREFKL